MVTADASSGPTATRVIDPPGINRSETDAVNGPTVAASAAAVVEPPAVEAPAPEASTRTVRREKRKRQPRYHVVLWNDDDHTYEYVVEMLASLFGHARPHGFLLAREVDTQGRVIVLTTTREHAELKRDQIHAFGKDRLLARSKGSMSASIEPETNGA